MNFLQRPKQFRNPGHRLHDRIKLAPGETAPERFQAWLAAQSNPPPCCRHHPREPLVVAPGSARSEPAFQERARVFRGPEPEVEPGVFEFWAFLHCPACGMAYALCPPEFHQTSFDSFDTSTPERTKVLASCRAFVSQVKAQGCGMMLMTGGPGCGKTRLASNIVRELHYDDALYVRQGELTLALRATYGLKQVFLRRGKPDDYEDQEEPPSPLSITQEVRFLVLDELGCNALANDERLLLDELLKVRYDERKPTILLSNLPLNELRDFLGDALGDRLKHATGNGKFLLQFTGESFRRTAGDDYLRPLPKVPESLD